MKAQDITGKRFGRLVARHRVESLVTRRPLWLLECDCGKVRSATVGYLNAGKVTHCGCQTYHAKRSVQTVLGPKASIPQAVGMRVRLARLRANVSQQTLADQLHYRASNAIWKIETGRMMPSIDVLVRIAKALNTDVMWLIEPAVQAE